MPVLSYSPLDTVILDPDFEWRAGLPFVDRWTVPYTRPNAADNKRKYRTNKQLFTTYAYLIRDLFLYSPHPISLIESYFLSRLRMLAIDFRRSQSAVVGTDLGLVLFYAGLLPVYLHLFCSPYLTGNREPDANFMARKFAFGDDLYYEVLNQSLGASTKDFQDVLHCFHIIYPRRLSFDAPEPNIDDMIGEVYQKLRSFVVDINLQDCLDFINACARVSLDAMTFDEAFLSIISHALCLTVASLRYQLLVGVLRDGEVSLTKAMHLLCIDKKYEDDFRRIFRLCDHFSRDEAQYLENDLILPVLAENVRSNDNFRQTLMHFLGAVDLRARYDVDLKSWGPYSLERQRVYFCPRKLFEGQSGDWISLSELYTHPIPSHISWHLEYKRMSFSFDNVALFNTTSKHFPLPPTLGALLLKELPEASQTDMTLHPLSSDASSLTEPDQHTSTPPTQLDDNVLRSTEHPDPMPTEPAPKQLFPPQSSSIPSSDPLISKIAFPSFGSILPTSGRSTSSVNSTIMPLQSQSFVVPQQMPRVSLSMEPHIPLLPPEPKPDTLPIENIMITVSNEDLRNIKETLLQSMLSEFLLVGRQIHERAAIMRAFRGLREAYDTIVQTDILAIQMKNAYHERHERSERLFKSLAEHINARLRGFLQRLILGILCDHFKLITERYPPFSTCWGSFGTFER